MTTRHLSWRYRRRRNARENKEFREAQSKRAQKRWDSVHDSRKDEAIRADRLLLRISFGRSEGPIRYLSIVNDGCYKRHVILEDGQPWAARCSRKKLLECFNNLLQASGV